MTQAKRLSCNASLAIVCKGELKNIESALDQIDTALEQNDLALVHKVLYPGKLWIKREAIVESEVDIEGERDASK
jgi:hypothetical protein